MKSEQEKVIVFGPDQIKIDEMEDIVRFPLKLKNIYYHTEMGYIRDLGVNLEKQLLYIL